MALVGMISNESRATARGAALVLDLHMALTFRNASASRIHGVMLRVVSQEVTLGGKGSVTYSEHEYRAGRSVPGAHRHAIGAAHADGGRTAGRGGPGWSAVSGPLVLRAGSPALAALPDGLRSGSAARPRIPQARAGTGRQGGLAAGDFPDRRAPASRAAEREGGAPRAAVTSAALPPEHPEKFALVEFPDSPVEAVAGLGAGGGQRSARAEYRSAQPVGEAGEVRGAGLGSDGPGGPAVGGGLAAFRRTGSVSAAGQDAAPCARTPPCGCSRRAASRSTCRR